MGPSILAGQDRMPLDNGMELRLLSALEVLQARREAEDLVREDRERALCSNACLLARALEQAEDHTPVFSSGQAVLSALTVEEIAALAGRWARFRQENNPGLNLTDKELETVKKKLRDPPGERLRWRVLKSFGALPTEARAKAMKDRDYLWCLVHQLLDREEELARLCPECRARAEEERCPVCGRTRSGWGEGAVNTAFDQERFERMRGGEVR